MYCADVVAKASYNRGNGTYICPLDLKNGGRQVSEKDFTSKWKEEMKGWLNAS